MHAEVMAWLMKVWNTHPALFRGQRVLECGSHAASGTARALFVDCDYTGLDVRPGPGVDVVCGAHEYQDAGGFDVILSTQMLEHDPHWRDSLANMVSLLAPGGALLLSWAGPGWPAHGTGEPGWPDYYRNLTPGEVVRAIESGTFRRVRLSSHHRHGERDGGLGLCLLALDKGT